MMTFKPSFFLITALVIAATNAHSIHYTPATFCTDDNGEPLDEFEHSDCYAEVAQRLTSCLADVNGNPLDAFSNFECFFKKQLSESAQLRAGYTVVKKLNDEVALDTLAREYILTSGEVVNYTEQAAARIRNLFVSDAEYAEKMRKLQKYKLGEFGHFSTAAAARSDDVVRLNFGSEDLAIVDIASGESPYDFEDMEGSSDYPYFIE